MLQTTVAASAAAVLAGWSAQHVLAATGALPAGVVASVLVGSTAALLAWRWLRQPAVTLRWDGQTWLADGQAVTMQLSMDIGSALLLRWRPAPAAPAEHAAPGAPWRWTAVSPRDAGPSWHALRTALLAHATSTAEHGGAWR